MKRKRVALLVETSLASGREILLGIAKYAREMDGWQLFHVPSGLGDPVPGWLEGWEGDGVIARVSNAGIGSQLQALGLPVMDVLGVVGDAGFPLVHVDNRQVAKLVARHFKERDFRRFAFYGIQGENWSMSRLEGFREACGQDIAHLDSLPGQGDGAGEGFTRLCQWLRGLPKPVGIFVASDQRGLVLLEACRAEGIAVPEQVAVVGVDNDVPLCEISSPQLTSVDAGHFQVGYEAARRMDKLMAGQPLSRHAFLVPPSGLVVRGSSDTQAIEDPVVATGLHFLRHNLAAPLDNALIAKAAGVSRTLFQKRFRQEIGCTVHAYLVNCRLERAKMLLTSSNLTLADIALRCGFNHQEYMGDVFKRHTGMTPGEWRKRG